MRQPLAAISLALDAVPDAIGDPCARAGELLALGEQTLEQWLLAHGQEPTAGTREGFRLLALHRQGARDDPSFNACRETCRELAWHYNLVTLEPAHVDTPARLAMMRFVARHLCYFVGGTLEQSKLGDFCCASRPLRQASEPPHPGAASGSRAQSGPS
jgi:hypothetical protein